MNEFLKTPELINLTETIYISGTAASGKTTVINEMSKRGVATMAEFVDQIPEWVINTRAIDSYERKLSAQLWTLEQHQQKDRLIVKPVVVDRTWVDSLIYASVYGQEVFNAVLEEANHYPWKSGSHVVLVTDTQTAINRLFDRDGRNEDGWKDFLNQTIEASIMVSEMFGFELIDSSHLTTQQIINRIIK